MTNQQRIKPKPKLRPIRPDELPYLFAVRDNLDQVVEVYRGPCISPIIKKWISFDYTYSTDGITWRPFTVEQES